MGPLDPVPPIDEFGSVAMNSKVFLVTLLAGLCHSQQPSNRRLECQSGKSYPLYFLKPASKTIPTRPPVNDYIRPSMNNIAPNDERVLRLDGFTPENSYFMVQVQDMDGNPVGKFKMDKLTPEDGIGIFSCNGTDDTALNMNPATERKSSFEVTWRAPASYPLPSGVNKTTFEIIYQIKGPMNVGDKEHPWARQYNIVKGQDLDYYPALIPIPDYLPADNETGK